ncbi:MAG: septum site-determining protein MinC [Chloroflexi bacterium]|nr:septum site-determining protein MinC [Chloroflexota bacterium]MDA1272120.1 septum site-determining protein MinC [Chloroflexota bacterium]PKB58564.1 MAG: septum site-determining protein MinC [SAR202 cluster bacterium Casp-Chloro-G2]
MPVLKTGVVQVMARGTDVAFVIDEKAPFDLVASELRDYLAKQNGLWSKGDITVNVGQRLLARQELAQVKAIIETHSGLKVTRFWCSPESLDGGDFHIEAKPSAARSSGSKRNTADKADKPPAHNEIVLPGEASNNPAQPSPAIVSFIEQLKARHNKNGARNRNLTEALFIKSTFRSGETVHHHGDVVVLADVNPGAEIRADGDIVVLGSLKGWVHAGASGDTKAVIVALELPSARFEIAKYQGIAPASTRRKSKSSSSGPRIAYVRNRSIHVAEFAGRFARYSKGVPYEG